MENNPAGNGSEIDQTRDAALLQSLWAYALLSWLMATIPALLLLPKLYAAPSGTDEAAAKTVQIIMIGFCSICGAVGGLFVGLFAGLARQKEWVLPLFLAPVFGRIWGIVIGTIAGFPIFFIGGIILGWMFAVPLGIAGFTLFAVVYESLAARRRLRWRHIVLIETAVLSALLAGGYYLSINFRPY